MFADHSHRLTANPPALYYGVTAADLLGTGRPQFFACGFGGPNRLLAWANGELRDRAPPVLADDRHPAIAAAAADLDGDGSEELYVLNADTFAGASKFADRLFRREPSGAWSDLLAHPANRAARNLSSGRSIAAVDRRGNGRYGFLVANYDRPMRFVETATDGTIADLAPALGLDAVTGGRSIWVGPLASDRPDLFCGNEGGPNFLYRNTGCGTFLEIAAAVRLADPTGPARGVFGLDADDDGRFDLAVATWDGANRLFLRQPDGTFRDDASPAMAFPGPVRTLLAADFDNDGYEELFFHLLGEPNRLFRRDPGSPLGWVRADCGAATDADGFGTGAAVADVDGDGRLELLLARGEKAPQPLGLFKVDTGDNHWLRVKPLTRFGAPARGAVVRLRAGGRTQLRVIDGGSGYLCQMEPVAHFGLGAVERVDEVRITWPDGATATVNGPHIRRQLDVPFPR